MLPLGCGGQSQTQTSREVQSRDQNMQTTGGMLKRSGVGVGQKYTD